MTQKFIIQNIDFLPLKTSIHGQDARHISRVLRLNKGDAIDITNGQGKDYSAVITSISQTDVKIDILEEKNTLTESPINITLCSGMLKDQKMDFVIKHITQLGIHSWIPFYCERAIPTPNKKSMGKRLLRWETIARESLKQCQRSCLPMIFNPVPFAQLLTLSESQDLKIAFWEKASLRLETLKKKTFHKTIMILIGPEGGFSNSEIDQALEKGFLSYSLGPRILRAETASISSCTLIQHILGDM